MTTELCVVDTYTLPEVIDEIRIVDYIMFDKGVKIMDCDAHRDLIETMLISIHRDGPNATNTATSDASHPTAFHEKLAISFKIGKKKTTLRLKLTFKTLDSVYFTDLTTVIKLPHEEFNDALREYLNEKDLI